jgi:CHAT domain-containing protein
MKADATSIVRRWICISSILLCLVGIFQRQAAAQGATFQAAEKVLQLVVDGRNTDAVTELKAAFEIVPPVERQVFFQFAARLCVALSDLDCASHFLDHFLKTDVKPADMNPSTIGYIALLWTSIHVMTGQPVEPIFSGRFPLERINPATDPVLFAELHLLAALQSRLASDFSASREHVDKALASTLSLGFERFDAPRLIVRIAYQLLNNYDVERAQRLIAAADPVLQTIRSDSLLAYDFLQLRAVLYGHSGRNFDEVSQDLHRALSMLDRLQLKPERRSYLKADTYNNLLGIEAIRGDRVAVQSLLQSHPLMAVKPSILKRGYFADESEFNFGVAEEFARFFLQEASETGWGSFMTMPPRWTSNPEKLQDVQAFGQAAVGLQLARAGKMEDARREFIEAGGRRLDTLQQRYRQSVFASPLPYWTDQLLLQLALAATLSSNAPDYEFVLGAHVVLGRSIETSPDDALATQASQASDERKRMAQSMRTIEYQRTAWEKVQLAALAKRLSATDNEIANRISRERYDVAATASNFIAELASLRAGLGRNSSPIVDLTALKEQLLPDEALIFYAPLIGHLAKVCVRRGQVLSTTQEVRDADAADLRILRAALTAGHPASLEADRQFPAEAAVRLRALLFGGLEECLKAAKRIYHIAPSATLGEVPPAALLSEVPPRLGSGYDLGKAQWMVRDHAFVKTTSINAFVATKKLSPSKRATLDYLGIGDPVLARRSAGMPSGGTFAARGSVPVQSGTLSSLVELPETSEELQQVARLFKKSKTRILLRENASEEDFRLQPLSEFDIIHFATHGVVKEELPGLLEPSLVFTPDPLGDTFNDGLLTSSQIATLPLRARLVILSACNSAKYEASVMNSGIQGLSTSFAIAGVPSMIASLWPIESSLTRDLIAATFDSVLRSADVTIADALAAAVRKHLDGPSPRPLLHPRFWAALVVVGDGSTMLGAASQQVVRDLGPYADPTSSNGREILSLTAFDGDFVSSTISAPNDKGSASLITRHAVDGTKKWEIKDPDISAGPTAAAKKIIYTSGTAVASQNGNSLVVPVLRGLTSDGKILWTYSLPSTPDHTKVMGLAVAPDQSALALVGPLEGSVSGSDFSLVRVDTDGSIVAQASFRSSPGDMKSRHSGHLALGPITGLAIAHHRVRLMKRHDRVNELGLASLCGEGDVSDIVFFDVGDLEVVGRTRIDRFEARAVLPVGDTWLVAGDIRVGCLWEKRAILYAIKSDGSVLELWRDASTATTSARGIRKVDDLIEVVGYSSRSVAIREVGSGESTHDESKLRLDDEDYRSKEVFSVRLSENGREQRRDFVGAGLPIVPGGMAVSGDHSVIFGTVGLRPLWMSR